MVKINVKYENGEQDVVRISNKQAEIELQSFLNRYQDASKKEWVKKIKGMEDSSWTKKDYDC
tara:strand:- start:727 stop:912 length:186 start_codon:yes stop_codon:yes gene_type:complete